MIIPQYFAHIDENDFVTEVHVVSQEFIQANPERYQGVWIETFLDVEGKTYAGIGYIYDAELDDFVAPAITE